MKATARGWLVDALVGGFLGAVIGAIVAVNLVIYSGIEGGYESSIADVFEQSTPTGIVTVAILIAGPVLGVFVARRLRRKRERASAA